MKALLSWIKTHPRLAWTLLGAALILGGAFALSTSLPWTCIAIGGAILFGVLISLVDGNGDYY